MMTKLINEAYGQIQNAPLRYYARGEATRADGKHSRARQMSAVESLSEGEVVLIEKRVEYAVRIICGVLSGAFVGLVFAEELFLNNFGFASTALICAIAFGAGAVKLGDKIWRGIFGLWWKWQ